MPKLKWDQTSQKLYETGVSEAVLYLMNDSGAYPLGVPWNGLTAVNENPSGAESNPIYANNKKYLDLRSAEEFGATIEAYTYPKEFEQCDGSAEVVPGVYVHQQDRKPFGFVYKTILGNDVEMNSYGYKLHLVYNGTASPSDKGYSTVNESPEAITFSWEITTTPISAGKNYKPTSHITIDSTKFTTTEDKAKLAALEEALYGGEGEQAVAHLPLPEDVFGMFTSSNQTSNQTSNP